MWRPTTISLTNELESLQKRAIKWILSVKSIIYFHEQYISKFKSLDILSLSIEFDLNDLLSFHKVMNNLVPVPLDQILCFNKTALVLGTVTLTVTP